MCTQCGTRGGAHEGVGYLEVGSVGVGHIGVVGTLECGYVGVGAHWGVGHIRSILSFQGRRNKKNVTRTCVKGDIVPQSVLISRSDLRPLSLPIQDNILLKPLRRSS